ncbi:MAG: nuclear transport factor 2 family protein [Candidatus Saccharibacteria bacterium]|nr:nuclear transport factor 2 family protein [Candidatus Saccharibacteria bacterium]
MNNTEIVMGLYKSFGERDIKTIINILSPEVEWGEPNNPLNPAGGTRHGHAGFLEWLEVGRQSEDILELTPSKFISQDDMVAVVGHTKCLAKPTGKTYETDFIHLIAIKDGKVIRFQEFFDTYAAAEAFRP